MVFRLLRALRHGPLRRLAPLWTSLGNVYRAIALHLPARWTVTTRIGEFGRFRVHPYFAFSDFAHWGSGHNAGFTGCVRRAEGATCVFDVGAHVGLVTLPMSRQVAPGGTVFAFEPAETNRGMLQMHVDANGASNVEIVDALVGASVEDGVEFYEMPVPTGMNSLVVRKHHDRYRLCRRRQTTIDHFCEERGVAPDLVKIDVEGAEIGVLRGAVRTLEESRPTVYLSVHPRELQLLGESTDELRQIIEGSGYDCLTADGQPADDLRLAEYVLVPRER